jgi:hypothetical protein
MGRIVDLCSEIATSAEEGPEGLVLAPEMWDRLRAEWKDDEIEDAMGLVYESIMRGELVESADSLSARLVDLLGAYGEPAAFRAVEEGRPTLTVDVLGQVARRVARLEEVLDFYREGGGPDRRAFDALRRRLIDVGLEDEMSFPDEDRDVRSHDEDEDEDEDEKR